MHPLFVIAILVSMSSTVFPVEEKQNRLFIGDLIHRDSPNSPFYNHSTTPSELSRNSLRHSINRANHLSSTFFDGKWFSSDLDSLPIPLYFMDLHIGSDNSNLIVAIDTTSNLLWAKSKEEETSSDTYRDLPSSSRFCDYVEHVPSSGKGADRICEFTYRYINNGWVKGILGTDSIYLRRRGEELYELESVAFGSSLSYSLNWGHDEIDGVIGLGRGLLSFVRQKEAEIEYKFSYCLLSVANGNGNGNGKIIFGTDPSTYDTKTITTLMVDQNHESLYRVSLRQISVQGTTTSYLQDAEYMILDPGPKHTFLRQDFYKEFRKILQDAIPYEVSEVSTPENIGPCYPSHTTGEHIRSLEIIFSFDGGKISLPYESTFEEFGPFSCCTILPHPDLSIFGSMAQVNLKVEYNLRDDHVSFTPTDCTTFPRPDQQS